VIASITRASDFSRVLKAPCRARSPHFAVHFLAESPQAWQPKGEGVESAEPSVQVSELSTDEIREATKSVDEGLPQGRWLGLVVPKKHAKRSVTRSLLKRRIRAAVLHVEPLDAGMWVVRLRSPFPRTEFSSAASDELGHVASAELARLMATAAASPTRR
jgi:ribonuclease P protein component